MFKRVVFFKVSFLIVSTFFIITGCDNSNSSKYYYKRCYSNKSHIVSDKRGKYSKKDLQLQKRLYGRWKKILRQKDGSLVFVTTIFNKNGRYSTYAIKKRGNIIDKKLYSKGTWSIKNGYLIEKTLSSNYAKKGSVTKDKVILITNRQFVYKTFKNRIFTYYRR